MSGNDTGIGMSNNKSNIEGNGPEAGLDPAISSEPEAGTKGLSDEEFLKELARAEAERQASGPEAAFDGESVPEGDSVGLGLAELRTRLAEVEAELADTKDQLLRKAADFDNYRKRTNLEKQKSIEFANESLLMDIIPIMDDFERALASAGSSPELAELPAGKAMLDGISMIEKYLVSQLEDRWGLKRFGSVGEPFDPKLHEALVMDKSPEVAEPTVMEEFVRGYMLKDRLIRAAKVKVLMPGEKDNP